MNHDKHATAQSAEKIANLGECDECGTPYSYDPTDGGTICVKCLRDKIASLEEHVFCLRTTIAALEQLHLQDAQKLAAAELSNKQYKDALAAPIVTGYAGYYQGTEAHAGWCGGGWDMQNRALAINVYPTKESCDAHFEHSNKQYSSCHEEQKAVDGIGYKAPAYLTKEVLVFDAGALEELHARHHKANGNLSLAVISTAMIQELKDEAAELRNQDKQPCSCDGRCDGFCLTQEGKE